ncbi:HIT-like domain-containing protein [Echria macrotheca]|uniref:Bis(5'-adenosyl)-triphosphatase n=1 Tax=Echria macrotheca TaxID=438768 RepID=A0AAJ0F9R6_9PEZI|nr:HIT-like domain-containing protein [Echria macrotheca]
MNHPCSRREEEQEEEIKFGPYTVTSQVFLKSTHSFALVNLKPLLPGHVLVCPLVPHRRLTDLSLGEITDLFATVQRVQRLLARCFFRNSSSHLGRSGWVTEEIENGGSFNIAVQDGPEAGQTVPHVHVHVIPRIKGESEKDGEGEGDVLYERMAGEDGNVGGGLWDLSRRGETERRDGDGDEEMGGGGGGGGDGVVEEGMRAGRPKPGGAFPRIEDDERVARSMEEMEAEAAMFRGVLREMEEEERRVREVRREVESVVPF